MDVLSTVDFPKVVNPTDIALIPKVDDPQIVKDFKLISLCDVLYKLISKCLLNHLRLA